jgi:mannitol-1-/sugar-/sorbitol-6-/2-deoxyglucose-6-phosphatase
MTRCSSRRSNGTSPADVAAYRAAVFDMDGLLVDSEVLWHQAELEILVPLGAAIDADQTRSTKGMFVDEVVAHYHALAPWGAPDQDEVVAQILTRVGDLVEEKGRLLPGAARTLERCGVLGPVALASSTPYALIDRTLRHFGLTDAFAVVHSAQDEPMGKPHPGVFLTAARRLGVPPARCLAFEDSPAGVRAAISASMGCVAVPAADERDDPAFALATLVLASLDDLDVRWLDEQFAPDGGADATPRR